MLASIDRIDFRRSDYLVRFSGTVRSVYARLYKDISGVAISEIERQVWRSYEHAQLACETFFTICPPPDDWNSIAKETGVGTTEPPNPFREEGTGLDDLGDDFFDSIDDFFRSQ